ncbi:MAG TPA: tetratricopeptide repeat protein [Polyangiaceae bacterium]|nr:tetratricopeptide repeat protein [Polyangiaceae bacterium]
MKEPELEIPRNSRTRVPHVVPGCDLRKLPLSTLEAYVFSRVDGMMAEDELVLCTGLESLVVSEALDRLASFGALSFSESVPRRSVSQTQTRATTSLPASAPEPRRTHSGAPVAPRTTAPPVGRSQFVTRPPAVASSKPAAAPAQRLVTAAPPRASVSPSRGPRALTPVPTTYRPGSMRPEHGDTLKRYLEGASTAITEGNAAAAANYYRLAQQLAPTDPAINTALADCSSVSAGARASSDRAATLLLLGDNAARAKQWGVSAGAYEEAASLIPKDPIVLYKLAGALYRCGGQLSRASKLVEESISLSRNRVEAWLLLAQIRWESGARVGARDAAEEARRQKPDDERVLKLLVKFGSVR